MQFSDDGASWSAWEPFSPLKHHTLAGPDGMKTIRFRVRDQAGNVADEASASILLHASPPVISNLTVSAIANDSATVGWTTDEPSTGQVEFGSGPACDRNQTSGGRARNHTVRLTGLSPSTTYRFRVTSTDEHSNNATSSPDQNFTTLKAYTPPLPAPKPAPVPEKGIPLAWVAIPLVAAGAAAGLLALARSRRKKAHDSPPEAMQSVAVDWGQPGPTAPAVTDDDENIETLPMDDHIPAAAAVVPRAPVRAVTSPVAERPAARTVRCTGCGTSLIVPSTVCPVRLVCPGCGKNGVYRGPRTN